MKITLSVTKDISLWLDENRHIELEAIGPTAKFIHATLLAYQMGETKVGQKGSPLEADYDFAVKKFLDKNPDHRLNRADLAVGDL